MMQRGSDLRVGFGTAAKLLDWCKDEQNNAEQLDWSEVTEEHVKQLYAAERQAAKKAQMVRDKGKALSDAFAAANLPARGDPSQPAAARPDAQDDMEIDDEAAAELADREAAAHAISTVGARRTAEDIKTAKAERAQLSRDFYEDKESAFRHIVKLWEEYPSSEVLLVVCSPLSGGCISGDSRGLLGNNAAVRAKLVQAVADVWDESRQQLARGRLAATGVPEEARWRRDGRYVLGAGGGFGLFCKEHKAELVNKAKQQLDGAAPDGKAISAVGSQAWHELPDSLREQFNERAADGCKRGRRALPAEEAAATKPLSLDLSGAAATAHPIISSAQPAGESARMLLASAVARAMMNGETAWLLSCTHT
jgi:hypothetical protein